MRQTGLGVVYDFDDIPEEVKRYSRDGKKAVAVWVSRRTEDRHDDDVYYEIAVWDSETKAQLKSYTRGYSYAKHSGEATGLKVTDVRFDAVGEVWIEQGDTLESAEPLSLQTPKVLYERAINEYDTQIARALYHVAIELPGDTKTRGLCFLGLGILDAAHGAFDDARRRYERAWEILEAEGTDGEKGACLFFLSDVQEKPQFDKALALLEAAGDYELAGRCCYRMAQRKLGGDAILERSVEHFRKAGADLDLAAALRLRAERIGTDEAFALLNEALGIVGTHRSRGARRREAEALETYGDIAAARGFRTEAADSFRKASELYRLVDMNSAKVDAKLAALQDA